jgi:hypothetical protein
MSDRTASDARPVGRARSGRRGGLSGRQTVGDYVGQPAGDAAQAVRRAGLRPGLDRSFGCAEELIGLVVEQDPTAGSDLARNGMVTLYVAAPGSELVEEHEVDAAETGSDEPGGALVVPVQAERAQGEAPGTPARARRRKRGRARRAAAAFDPCPPPALPDQAPVSEAPTVVLVRSAVEPPREPPAGVNEPDGALVDETAEEPRDEFVVRAEDVLAGRMGPAAWRGAYPRRARRELDARHGPRGWLRRHRLASSLIAVAVLLWAIVAVAAALDGQDSHNDPAAGAITRSERLTVTHRIRAAKPASAPSSRTPRSPARTAQPRPVARTQRRRSAPAPVGEAIAAPVAAGEAPARGAPPPASGASAPPAAPEQRGGGLFSP